MSFPGKLAVTVVHDESVLLCEFDQFANNLMKEGGIGLCTRKATIISGYKFYRFGGLLYLAGINFSIFL